MLGGVGPARSGSIPACAGEPSGAAFSLDCLAVYPRVCGGTAQDTRVLSPAEGLSPRVRGNLSGGWGVIA